MDPNATLTEIRELVAKYNDWCKPHDEEDAHRLVGLIEALDDWIKKGGVLPKDWAQAYARAIAEMEV